MSRSRQNKSVGIEINKVKKETNLKQELNVIDTKQFLDTIDREIIKDKELSLKQKLDAIDQQVIINYGNKYGEAMSGVYIGQWWKGKAVQEGGGGLGQYRKLERETGRSGEYLKMWHDLYEQYEDDFAGFLKEYVKPKVDKLIRNWIKGMLGKVLTGTDWLKVYDIWNFAGINYSFGIRYPGNIPAGIILNILHYYTEENDLVVDPMAGGGVTIDCCKHLNRNCLAYDIQPKREDIKKNDILLGYPDEAKSCDLIFLDPPYSKKKEEDYGPASISALDKENYFRSFNIIAKESYRIIKGGGYLAFLMEPYIDYQDSSGSIWLYDYIKIFLGNNWFIERIYDVPQTSERYQGHDISRAKEEKIVLTLRRELVVFKKRN